MKGLSITVPFIMLLMIQPLVAQQVVTLTVVIDSIQTVKGNILVAIYDNEEGYKSSKAFQSKKTRVTGSKVTTTFRLPADADYAVALFQDINENDTLDTRGSMKIPVEPFGFSNNKKGTFGPPGYDKIVFALIADTTFEIHLISSRKSFFQKGG